MSETPALNRDTRNLQLSLLLLRLGVFTVMIMWVIDKFVNPGHAAAVANRFYMMPEGMGATLFYVLGALQAAVVIAFVLGFKKRFSYGIVLAMHTVSTFSSFAFYLDPWGPKHLLFFAAWPMLAACIALYLMRDSDKLLTVSE